MLHPAGEFGEVVQAAGQGMAIGVTFGESLSGRHRFGGGGGWRLARFVAACLMALQAVANGALAQQTPDTAANPKPPEKVVSISGNPAATDIGITGTGWLGRTLGLKDEWGVKLGGMWLADTNVLVAGGAQPGGWTNNQALVLGLNVQAEKLVGWRGASFGVQFLQFNGGETNEQAGSIAGYNSIVSLPPLNRTELLEAWYRQEMVPEVLSMRIGRSMPSYDFGNVSRPIALADPDFDGRADLYSLACVAYYLLTGQFVFAANTPLAAALAHVNDQPPPLGARSPFQVPARLEAVILQCLAKDPAERPASAVDLANRLAETVPQDAWTADAAHAWWDHHRLNEPPASIRGATADKAGSGSERRRCGPRLDSDAAHQ